LRVGESDLRNASDAPFRAWRILQFLPPHQPLYHALDSLTVTSPPPATPASAGKKGGAPAKPPVPVPVRVGDLLASPSAGVLLYKLLVRVRWCVCAVCV
jgi:hypothetical protein